MPFSSEKGLVCHSMPLPALRCEFELHEGLCGTWPGFVVVAVGVLYSLVLGIKKPA